MYSFFMKYLATNRKKAKYIIFLFETDTKRSPAHSPAFKKKGRSPRGATGPNISKVIFI
jgi:hypothetical protein